jgi:glycosyltransferase involved in cell wall biosynthesis
MSVVRTRVLLIGHTFDFGGTEGQFVEVACGLDPSRWDVHLACLRAAGPLRARIEAAGLHAWTCGRGSFKSPRFLTAVWGIARYLRAHRIRLVHSFDFYSNILGITAARLARVPAIIASQRDLGDTRPLLHRRVHGLGLWLADYVLVNSPAVAERVKRQWAIAPKRIVLIPNGVNLARFSRAPGRSGRQPGRPTIGALAVLRPEKGLADFVRAAALTHARVPEARFVIWGDGPVRVALESLAAELGLTGAMEFRGLTAQPEAALRELDIFVLPSLTEACSNGLLEAMASGLPVVATDVGGNPALVEDEVTGLLVPVGDAAALAKAILRLIEDPPLAERLGAAAREVACARFGLNRMLSGVQALYERALSGPSASWREET